jgi:hypothetical protein
MFRLVSAYSLSQNIIESAETSRLFHQPNQPLAGSSVRTGPKAGKAVFTSHANPNYFLFHPSHQIFGRMHGALNIGKKDN